MIKKLLYISNNKVDVFNGNLNCEIQRIRKLKKNFKVTYFSLICSRKEVETFFEINEIRDVDILTSPLIHLLRLLYKLNYLFNVAFCIKFGIFQNFKFLRVTLITRIILQYDLVFSFYIFPAIFLKLYELSNRIKIIIDTNDIVVNRHELIGAKVWFSINENDEKKFDRCNIFFACISETDYEFYKKKYANVLKLYYSHTPIYTTKNPNNFLGYISSYSSINISEFNSCYKRDIFSSLYKSGIRIITYGSIQKYIKRINTNELIFNHFSGSIDEFYSTIKVLFVPSGPSTGIKTKLVEALYNNTFVITTKYGYDNSLFQFSDFIRVIEYPINNIELLNALETFNENSVSSNFNDTIYKYEALINEQFHHLCQI